MKVSWTSSKRRLAALWFTGAGLLFFIILVQSVLGRYGNNSDQAWSWFLPTIMPTLSLIIGVIVMDARAEKNDKKTTDLFIYRLTFVLSFCYFITVSMTIFLAPFSSLSCFELMKQSNLWLAPFQGLVSASMGVFFIKKE